MSDVYPPPPDFSAGATIGSMDRYNEIYGASIRDPEAFWAEVAERITWRKRWDQVLEHDFVDPSITWFSGGKLNASENCLDRHVDGGRGDKTALIWEGDDPADDESFTYSELLARVSGVVDSQPTSNPSPDEAGATASSPLPDVEAKSVMMSIAPERTNMSVISSDCSPVSGCDTSNSSTLTPSFSA